MSGAEDARRWFAQADADLAAARDNAKKHPYVACFLAQQAAEKALKGVQLSYSGMAARTHSLSKLNGMLQDLGCYLDGVEQKALRDLERMFTEARYPDLLPDASPAEYFTPEDAEEAIRLAETIVNAAKTECPGR